MAVWNYDPGFDALERMIIDAPLRHVEGVAEFHARDLPVVEAQPVAPCDPTCILPLEAP